MSTSKPTAPPFRVIADGSVTTPLGFRAGAATGGIKHSGKPDVAVLACDGPAQFAAAFTRNAFAAAPVNYSRQVAQRAPHLRACVINSGNANCGTGRQGALDAQSMASAAADCLNVNADEVLVFSTGRIGVPMPMAKVTAGIRGACGQLARDQGLAAATAIMTTDTVRKSLAIAVDIAGAPVHLGGMAKGVGMIAPHLAPVPKQATMLAFVTTDAKFAPGVIETIFAQSLDQSFNRITVDGDTSTNDSFVALASGLAELPAIRSGTVEAERFQQAFNHVAGELAKAMVRDGEGATRLVELRVVGARTPADAEVCAKTIANSLLVKTAWFGGDPNWGRILAAAGRSGATLDPTETSLYFEGVAVVRGGMPAGTPEAELAKLVDRKELHLELDLGLGSAEYTVWTCDLSYEYVKINAEYRT